jgi:alpha-L-fucosidase
MTLYQPTLQSVRSHPLPAWYDQAKFGIFIHWTPASVPAYAPIEKEDFFELLTRHSQAYAFAHQPYVEWYWNSLRIPGSPAQRYHLEKYGDAPYERFKDEFKAQMQQWDPDSWADLFAEAGARYAVLVTKHHDGFLLWPSRTPHPYREGYHASRSVVSELSQALRLKGLKMGFYYSSILDWSFTEAPIQSFADLMTTGPATAEYIRYVESHWKELIDDYQPDLLWNDIGYPSPYALNGLFAYYYNRLPEGVINDRWMQIPTFLRGKLGRWLMNAIIQRSLKSGSNSQPKVPHCDFLTTEYSGFDKVQEKKWEACRGIGLSFGYNQFETEAEYKAADELIRMLVEIVSKNGNFLLNVGPRPDGSIPEPQARALQGIGAWLKTNGEAIYGTRPFSRPSDIVPETGKMSYTVKDGQLFVHLLDWREGIPLRLPGDLLAGGSTISWLVTSEALAHERKGEWVELQAGGTTPPGAVKVLRITPSPTPA